MPESLDNLNLLSPAKISGSINLHSRNRYLSLPVSKPLAMDALKRMKRALKVLKDVNASDAETQDAIASCKENWLSGLYVMSLPCADETFIDLIERMTEST